jgi:hypothetical protein
MYTSFLFGAPALLVAVLEANTEVARAAAANFILCLDGLSYQLFIFEAWRQLLAPFATLGRYLVERILHIEFQKWILGPLFASD